MSRTYDRIIIRSIIDRAVALADRPKSDPERLEAYAAAKLLLDDLEARARNDGGVHWPSSAGSAGVKDYALVRGADGAPLVRRTVSVWEAVRLLAPDTMADLDDDPDDELDDFAVPPIPEPTATLLREAFRHAHELGDQSELASPPDLPGRVAAKLAEPKPTAHMAHPIAAEDVGQDDLDAFADAFADVFEGVVAEGQVAS